MTVSGACPRVLKAAGTITRALSSLSESRPLTNKTIICGGFESMNIRRRNYCRSSRGAPSSNDCRNLSTSCRKRAKSPMCSVNIEKASASSIAP
jgi:hypothetical protein